MHPVAMLVFWACLWTGLVAGVEVLTNRQTGLAVNQMKGLTGAAKSSDSTLHRWVFSPDAGPTSLRRTVGILFLLVLVMLVLRVSQGGRQRTHEHGNGLLHPRGRLR